MVKLGPDDPQEVEAENASLKSKLEASGCHSGKTEREREEKDIWSEEEERGWSDWSDWSEITTQDQNDDEGFRNPWGDHGHQPSVSVNNKSDDPWGDFNQLEQTSFSSESDSDDEDDEIIKIRFKIKPITATTASVEELQRAASSLNLHSTLNMVKARILYFLRIKLLIRNNKM